MSFRSDNLDEEEYKFYANRENAQEQERIEEEMWKDACIERCENCKLYDWDSGKCEAGEDIFNCTLVG